MDGSSFLSPNLSPIHNLKKLLGSDTLYGSQTCNETFSTNLHYTELLLADICHLTVVYQSEDLNSSIGTENFSIGSGLGKKHLI